MLEKKEENRIGWGDVFTHPFFSEFEKKEIEIIKNIEQNINDPSNYLHKN